MTTPSPSSTLLLSKLKSVKHILCVLSGKGGVGKSSVSVQLALSLLAINPKLKIGLLDIDLTGPSLPRMLGLEGKDVHSSIEGWVPVYLDANTGAAGTGGGGVLACMSIGFLLKNSRDSVVWRGPKKNAMIKQFLGEVRWGELDYLIVDTPPGTSDEHISLLENLRPLLIPHPASLSLPTLSCLLVTTPQAVALLDVSKELSFIRRTEIPLLGLIENMSGYVCPHCSDIVGIFGLGGGENFCKLEEERKDSEVEGEGGGCKFLGRIPIDRDLVGLLDGSEVVKLVSENQALVTGGAAGEGGKDVDLSGLELDSTSVSTSTSTTSKKTLVERYTAIPSFPIVKEITNLVVELIAAQEEKEKAVRIELGL